MSRSTQEIATLLASKFKRESARLNSWGTKTDEKAALSFAMSVVEFVRALMAESRCRELKRIKKKCKKYSKNRNLAMGIHVVDKYVEERITATSSMAKAIEVFAIKKEGQRVWKPKVHKHKHKHKHRI